MSNKKLTTVKLGDDEHELEPDEEEEEEDEIKSDSDSDDTSDTSDESEKESNKSQETDTIDDEEDSIVSSTDEDTEDEDEEEDSEDAGDDEDGIKNKPMETFKIEKKPKKNNKKPATAKKSKKHDDEDIEDMIDDINIDDGEDEDEDIEPDYLQKFNESIRKKIIEQYHPEMIIKNNAEIETLSRVVRDSNGNIIDPFHKTLPFLTKYEKARILGERANQINEGSPVFVDVDNDVIDGYLIALKEFDERKIPFIIQRPLPNGTCEYWRLQDLEII